MRSISKYEHCRERAEKCLRQAECMCQAAIMAPMKMDFDYCLRKHRRAVKHMCKYRELMAYYGGNYERDR